MVTDLPTIDVFRFCFVDRPSVGFLSDLRSPVPAPPASFRQRIYLPYGRRHLDTGSGTALLVPAPPTIELLTMWSRYVFEKVDTLF